MIGLEWISEQEILQIHEVVLAQHGGASGVRDRGLLLSALARPQQHAAYAADLDLPFLAAIYTEGIVKNHPFVDGNKRTGFVAGVLFLETNGFLFFASEEDAANAVIMLAAGEIDAEGYAAFVRDNSKAS